MQAKKIKPANQVHVLTQRTSMKFIPANFIKQKPKPHSNQMIKSAKPAPPNRFSFSSIIWRKNKSSIQTANETTQQTSNLPSSSTNIEIIQKQAQQSPLPTQRAKTYKLKFAYKLSPDHFLIGNEFQLDLINILGINSNKFVETQYLWSISSATPIQLVGVDQKKQNLFAIVSNKTLIIYKYDNKKLTCQPLKPFAQIALTEQPKFLQIVKDGNICLFYEQRLQIWLVAEQVRRRFDKKYEAPAHIIDKQKYILFMVPQPFEGILNVFFEQKYEEGKKIFTLWCVQIQFLASQIKVNLAQKIYDIKSGLRKTLNLKNYSKQIFLMNLGSQILALKKGYILDSANVNLKHQQSFLEYIGNQTLLHITQKKIQVYTFIVNINVKPFRILIKPKDSIRILQNQKQDQFFKVFSILSNDLLFIYQKDSLASNSKCGEIQYSFYVTRSISREAKINHLFPLNTCEDFRIDDPVLMDKCDMAQKMGLSTKQIYLQLWNRSMQSRKQDYSILIATKDYNTINQQIVRKLKKSSMNFKEIQNIQDACFEMLREKVFSSSCTSEAVMDYITSHFFKRKLQMFKDIQMMQKFEKEQQTGKQQNQVFKMTIRQYQQYKSMEIKSYLIELVNQFCHQQKRFLSKNIRFLLRNFKFVYRMIYHDLLESIVQTAKDRLLQLITQIPELLPYHPPQAVTETRLEIPVGFYEGVWPSITKEQENINLYVDAITTIDNKQIIMEQVIKSLNFKRNWLSQHDMVLDSMDKIKANYQKIKSPLTFYFFAAKMFKYIQNKQVLKNIVDFLQQTYQLPTNLRGTIFLNQRLYRFFIDRNIAPEISGRPYTLSQFFSFEDKQLIRHCFDKQRSNKGLLLKDIKDIFKEVLHEQADQKYNTALLNYFISDLSQISDLKYILNRINNQKLEFHKQNQKMYVILVEALQRKLKIGTQNDIPIEQVLMYIENIPLDQNSPPLLELRSISMIEKDSQMLRQAKLNMSIYDILHKYDETFIKLISYAVDTAPPQTWESYQCFNQFAIKNLAKLELFAQDVYIQFQNKYIFFVLLTKLCQSTNKIKFANYLLKNSEYKQKIDETTAENLVIFMTKWKFSNQKEYVRNVQYMQELLKILSEESAVYRYLFYEFEFAKILSAPGYPVTFPISQGNLSASDIRDLIFYLPIDFIMTLDVQKLYQVTWQIQQAMIQDMKYDDYEGAEEEMISAVNRITLHQIYEFFIIKMINCNKLKQVLPYIRRILDIEVSNPTNNIIYLIFYIIQLSSELTETNKNNLTYCISHYFYNPKGLLQILQYIMTNPLSTFQAKVYIEGALQAGKQQCKGYNENNPVFDENYIAVIQDVETQANFMLTLNKTSKHLQLAKEEFKNIKYSAIMIMLCNSPYTLAKYISCSYNYDLNVKSIRSFLSYAINQSVFKPLAILELGRRIFLVLLSALKNRYPIEVVIENYEEIGLQNDTDIQRYEPPKNKTQFEYLMWKSAEAFKKKKQAYLNQMRLKATYTPQESVKQKTEKIKSQLGQVPPIEQRDPYQYPFPEIDSDNEVNDALQTQDNKIKKRAPRDAPKFDASQQMKNILQQQRKTHKLFLSTRGEKNNNNAPINLSISIRQSGKGGYESNKQLKISMKSRDKVPHFQEVAELGQSQDFGDHSQCKTDRHPQLRPTKSAMQSQPRLSVDSSPQIMHTQTKQLKDKIIQSEQQKNNQKQRKNSGASIQKASQNSFQNYYEIQVKQVIDPQDLIAMETQQFVNLSEGEVMIQSTQMANTEQIAKTLVQVNKDTIQNPLADFNLEILIKYQNNKLIIIDVLKQLFKLYNSNPNFNRIMKMMGQIVLTYPVAGIDNQIFGIIIKAQQAQTKTIPQIKFSDLISEEALVQSYQTKRDLFDKLYYNLSKYVDSENIYKITQFIRRVFDESQFEQQVTWDFILDLCERLQNNQQQDHIWNLQKIQANLAKVDIHIWNKKFQNFKAKVLSSTFKNTLIQLFCKYLNSKKGNREAIIFMQKLNQIEGSEVVRQSLQHLKENI